MDYFNRNAKLQQVISRMTHKWQDRGKFVIGDVWETFGFIVSEVGELADAMLRSGNTSFVRNNPGEKTEDHVAEELGDVVFMCFVLGDILNIDVETQVRKKLGKMDEKRR